MPVATWPQVVSVAAGCLSGRRFSTCGISGLGAAPLGTAHVRRRTLATGILPFTRSVLTRFAILAALVSKRRLPGTGSPSLSFLRYGGASTASRLWNKSAAARCGPPA
jgi:hypothetical protein